MRLLPVLASAITAVLATAPKCQFNVNGHTYDLSSIAGPQTIEQQEDTPPSQHKMIFTLDPCESLKLDKKQPNDEQCPDNTIVCGLGYTQLPKSSKFELSQIMPFGNGAAPQYKPLRDSGDVEGISTSYTNPWGGVDIGMTVDYVCSPTEEGPKLDYYRLGGEFVTIVWKTPAACKEPPKSDPGSDKPDSGKDKDKDKGGNTNDGTSWGWFTWLFIIIVLGIAVYIIGNAWINYDRYGNAGVDLLPHSDSVRDIPYLIRDFVYKVVGTFTGGSRTGYSAV